MSRSVAVKNEKTVKNEKINGVKKIKKRKLLWKEPRFENKQKQDKN